MPLIHGLPRPEPLRKIPPRQTRPYPEQHPVDHPPMITPPPTPVVTDRQERLQPLPLLITEVTPPIHNPTNESVIDRTRPSRGRPPVDRHAPRMWSVWVIV